MGVDLTVNPGNALLILTLIVCVAFFIAGGLSAVDGPFKRFVEAILSSKKSWGCCHGKIEDTKEPSNEEKELESVEARISSSNENEYHLHQEDQPRWLKVRKNLLGGRKKRQKQQKNNDAEKNKTVKIKVNKQSERVGRSEEKLEFKDFQFWRNDSLGNGTFSGKSIHGNQGAVDDRSVITENSIPVVNGSSGVSDSFLNSEENYDATNKEMKELFRLAAPWMVQSVVTEFSEVIYMMLISHYVSSLTQI